jgi:hypothetical protein
MQDAADCHIGVYNTTYGLTWVNKSTEPNCQQFWFERKHNQKSRFRPSRSSVTMLTWVRIGNFSRGQDDNMPNLSTIVWSTYMPYEKDKTVNARRGQKWLDIAAHTPTAVAESDFAIWFMTVKN